MTESTLRSVDLAEIMADSKKIILKHGEKPYLLSITRRGKLILTAAETNDENENAKTDAQ
ncbi:hemin uptake protein HemP [Leucothrix mucor]|jgi:hemin uptake protein HemP|uniref:hemin uptake protein HemP n=1 Tax=Leucothrix mucor TaxID=45248 RepID=UPI0003B5446D|nr:hemin uptake protein HemP [Leucothrix mucor]